MAHASLKGKSASGKSARSWMIPVFFAWASLFSLGVIDNSRGPVFPDLLNEFQVSDTMGSLFFFVASLASVIHNVIFRRFLAESSPLRLVGLYTLIMAAGALLSAGARSYWVMLFSALVLGVGFGGLGVGQNAAVQEAPARFRSRSLGLLHAMYGVSSFLAPLLVAALQPFGWRLALVVAAVPAAAVGIIIMMRLAFEKIHGLHRARKAEAELVVDNLRGPDDPPRASTLRLRHHDRDRASRIAAILIAFLVIAEISISSRLTLLARREWGVSADAASGWLAAYFAAMTMARFSLGFLPQAVSSARVLKWTTLANVPILMLAFISCLLPISMSIPTEFRLLALVLFGFPIAVGYPMTMTRIAEIFGAGTQKVTGKCVLYQAVAAMVMHFLLGTGADFIGLERTLAIISIAAAGGALIAGRRLERVVNVTESAN